MRYYLVPVLFFSFLVSCNNDPLSKLPAFEFRLADSITVYNTQEIPEGRPVILIQYSSNCHECQLETEDIIKNISHLKNTRIYFLTQENFKDLKFFIQYYKLYRYPNIIIGQDYNKSMQNHFQDITTPLMAIYDGENNLRVVYRGKTEISKLVNLLGTF